MSKFDQFVRLSEDSVEAPSTSVMPSSPAQTSNPPTNTEFASLHDLLKYKNGMDVGDPTNAILGVPLQHILTELVNLYVQSRAVELRFKEAAKNPVYRDKPELKPVFKRVDQSVKSIQSLIKTITVELDNLSLD